MFPYGSTHRGREITISEMIFFSFAVKTSNEWICFQTFCNFLCELIYTKVRSSDF